MPSRRSPGTFCTMLTGGCGAGHRLCSAGGDKLRSEGCSGARSGSAGAATLVKSTCGSRHEKAGEPSMEDSSGRPAYGESNLGRPRVLGYTGATGTSPMWGGPGVRGVPRVHTASIIPPQGRVFRATGSAIAVA